MTPPSLCQEITAPPSPITLLCKTPLYTSRNLRRAEKILVLVFFFFFFMLFIAVHQKQKETYLAINLILIIQAAIMFPLQTSFAKQMRSIQTSFLWDRAACLTVCTLQRPRGSWGTGVANLLQHRCMLCFCLYNNQKLIRSLISVVLEYYCWH